MPPGKPTTEPPGTPLTVSVVALGTSSPSPETPVRVGKGNNSFCKRYLHDTADLKLQSYITDITIVIGLIRRLCLPIFGGFTPPGYPA